MWNCEKCKYSWHLKELHNNTYSADLFNVWLNTDALIQDYVVLCLLSHHNMFKYILNTRSIVRWIQVHVQSSNPSCTLRSLCHSLAIIFINKNNRVHVCTIWLVWYARILIMQILVGSYIFKSAALKYVPSYASGWSHWPEHLFAHKIFRFLIHCNYMYTCSQHLSVVLVCVLHGCL